MTPPQRINWIDAVRGLAILAVLSYHVDLGMRLSDMHPPEGLRIALATLDLVRMPLLMFIAGLALASFSGPGRSVDMRGRFLKLLLPYLVWSFAYATLWYLFPTDRNHRDLSELALTPLFPASHLWFLQALLIYTLTIPLLRRLSAPVSFAEPFRPPCSAPG